MHLATLQPLVSAKLYDDMLRMFHRLSAPFVWDLPNGKEKLRTIEEATQEVLTSREIVARTRSQTWQKMIPRILWRQGGISIFGAG